MTFKKGDEVVVCYPDHATDGVIEAIYEDEAAARVFMPFTSQTKRADLSQIIPRPIPVYQELAKLRAK